MEGFGTGYSSIGYLRRFPFDKIKIDQSLIRVLSDGQEETQSSRYYCLATSLGIFVTAEGVETNEQLEFLQSNGCGQVQGFLFSRPVPAAEVAGLLSRTFAKINLLPSDAGPDRQAAMSSSAYADPLLAEAAEINLRADQDK